MLKQLHKIFLYAILICSLSFPSVVYAVNEPYSADKNGQKEGIELIQNDVQVEDSEIEPINTESVKKSVVPDTSKEGKKIIGLFLKSMVALAFCILTIYLILLFIKRYYYSSSVLSESEEFESLDLSTPNNKNDALKSFLNRTK